ncbi:MAG: ORF6N domain-containing protein [Ignavibacteriales bacterium]|nr:ORF6N domain-containing protein [Ignavibacteriales bacterium]
MNSAILTEKILPLLLKIRGLDVLLDSDVADIYAVETKRINEAVKNNPDKFPNGYIVELTRDELNLLRSKFSSAKLSKTRSLPSAFTEKGLYMLATILRSKTATNTTLAIIETFARIRELSRNIKILSEIEEGKEKKGLIKKSGELISGIIEDDLRITNTETSVEFNFAVVKLKHVVKRGGSKRD